MSVADKLTAIGENVPKVYKAGQMSILESSEVLHGTASGEIIAVRDVNPVEHNLGVGVRSKNLIPYPYAETTKTLNGVTFTDNGDGSITVNGTATANATFRLYKNNANLLLERSKTYTASAEYTGTYSGTVTFVTNYYPVGSSSYSSMGFNVAMGNTKTTQIPEDAAGFISYLVLISGATAENLTIYPQIQLGDTATDYALCISGLSAVTVSRYGKNLWNEQWENGIYSTATGLQVPNTSYIRSKNNSPIPINPSTKYCCISPQRLYVMFYDENLSFISYKGAANEIITTPSNCKYIKFYVHADYGTAYLNDICVCLAAENNDFLYEPYIEPQTATASADGTVEGLTSISPNMTLMTDTDGAVIDLEYYKDIDLAFENLTTAIALSGGE